MLRFSVYILIMMLLSACSSPVEEGVGSEGVGDSIKNKTLVQVVPVPAIDSLRKPSGIKHKQDTTRVGRTIIRSGYHDPDQLAKDVLKAFTAKDISLLNRFMLRKQADIDYVKECSRVGEAYDTEEELNKEVNELVASQDADLKEYFNECIEEGKDAGLDWSTAALYDVEYDIAKEDGVIWGDFTLFLKSNGKKFSLDFSAMQAKTTWIVVAEEGFDVYLEKEVGEAQKKNPIIEH